MESCCLDLKYEKGKVTRKQLGKEINAGARNLNNVVGFFLNMTLTTRVYAKRPRNSINYATAKNFYLRVGDVPHRSVPEEN